MSSILATRTPRLAPPAKPTRTATPRRRTVGQGASIVARADRPVLRIVVEDEQSPVVTRVMSEPCEAPIRRVALDDFFASEWEGDDVSVEIARPLAKSLRLTRRGRLVIFGAGLAAALGLGFVAASGSLANDKPEPTRVVTVQPGQTLWDIAAGVNDSGDVRTTMAHLEDLNHLASPTLQVGQTLRVPR
jgi:hypothetical protein